MSNNSVIIHSGTPCIIYFILLSCFPLFEQKLHLRAECEKEIEVVAASIRKKYDLKLQEAEAAYLLKKNELDMNQKKVLMNKALANAFRFKCIDLEITARPVVQQGTYIFFVYVFLTIS